MTTLTKTLEPQTLDEATTLARAAVASKLYAVGSPEAALMILLTGRDLGLTASQSFRAIYVVSGKPVVSSDAMVAAIRRSGLVRELAGRGEHRRAVHDRNAETG